MTPRALQEKLNAISDESYRLHQEMATIVERSAEAKLELMKTCGSGKEVDMRYAATADGRRESYLRVYLRGLSHLRTSIIQEVKANSGHF